MYIGIGLLSLKLPGKRKRGSPKRRFIDVVREAMAVVEVTQYYAEDWTKWRLNIRCGYP